MGLYQTRGPPVHARVCPMHATQIKTQITCQMTASTISAGAPKLWTMTTICTTGQQCPAPQQTTNKVHPGSDWNFFILCKGGQQHNNDGTQCYHNGASNTNNYNTEKYTTVSRLCSHKQGSCNHMQSEQHGFSSAQ